MLFEFIKDIAFRKEGNLLDHSENELQFNGFSVQRALSMFSPKMCHILNETANKKLGIFSKKELYKLFLLITPKQKNEYFKYIKKNKADTFLTEPQTQIVEMLQEKYKVSNREMKLYISELNLDVDKLTRGLN